METRLPGVLIPSNHSNFTNVSHQNASLVHGPNRRCARCANNFSPMPIYSHLQRSHEWEACEEQLSVHSLSHHETSHSSSVSREKESKDVLMTGNVPEGSGGIDELALLMKQQRMIEGLSVK